MVRNRLTLMLCVVSAAGLLAVGPVSAGTTRSTATEHCVGTLNYDAYPAGDEGEVWSRLVVAPDRDHMAISERSGHCASRIDIDQLPEWERARMYELG